MHKWLAELFDADNSMVNWRTGNSKDDVIQALKKSDHVGHSLIVLYDPAGLEVSRVSASTLREAVELL